MELVGKSLGRYQIMALLGEGGMGAVYQGVDPNLNRDVAIKIMHPHFSRRHTFRQRFMQEAQAAASLSHPNVVTVFDFDRDDSGLYIVMEFIPGGNLHQLMRQMWQAHQWIALDEAVTLVQYICRAVDYLHQRDILHRDIKPSNIMLKQGQSNGSTSLPVLTDLGLAKLIDGAAITASGSSMGTPAYMSPEQAQGDATDSRSDVYSLGILFYELAAGRLPFPIKTLTDAIRYHAKEEPPPPTTINPNLPPFVEKAILKALQKEPDRRFASAAEFADALNWLAGQIPGDSFPPTALDGTTTLATFNQESMVQPRGQSVFGDISELPEEAPQTQLLVLNARNKSQTVEFRGSRMTVGRSSQSGLVLSDANVSARHARIEYDGMNFKVVDLDSSNGTYLSGDKLIPGVPEIWTPEKVLRIGRNYLKLLPGNLSGHSDVRYTDGTMVDPSLLRSSAGEGRVATFLATTDLTVEAGQSLSVPLTILNQGPVVDHFKTTVSGIPREWVSIMPGTVEILPGDQKEITLVFRPPRTSQSRAGGHPIIISVTSQDALDQSVQTSKVLTVTPFHQYTSSLSPQRLARRNNGTVIIHNQSNCSQTFEIKWQDRADEINFSTLQTQITAAAGEEISATFRAEARHRPWFGNPKAHRFTAKIRPAQGESQELEGEVTHRPLFPVWVPALLLFTCLMLTGFAAFYQNEVWKNEAAATATAVAAATAEENQAIAQANVTATAEMAVTQTAEALKNANQATKTASTAAASATAEWRNGDDDRDGLTNQREEEMGTDPYKRDTDEDGLDDGAESIDHYTDPLKSDSDGDGCRDGEEIRNGSNPLQTDTDRDGLGDCQDGAPQETSTPTPNLTATNEWKTKQENATATAEARDSTTTDKSVEKKEVPETSKFVELQLIHRKTSTRDIFIDGEFMVSLPPDKWEVIKKSPGEYRIDVCLVGNTPPCDRSGEKVLIVELNTDGSSRIKYSSDGDDNGISNPPHEITLSVENTSASPMNIYLNRGLVMQVPAYSKRIQRIPPGTYELRACPVPLFGPDCLTEPAWNFYSDPTEIMVPW